MKGNINMEYEYIFSYWELRLYKELAVSKKAPLGISSVAKLLAVGMFLIGKTATIKNIVDINEPTEKQIRVVITC